MRKSVNIYVLSLIVLFFVSTTGVTVYKHYCNHEGELYRFFVNVDHECDEKETEPQACHPDTHSSNVEKNKCCDLEEVVVHENCCTSDVELHQIDTDLIVHDGKISIDYNSSIAFYTPVTIEYVLQNKVNQPKNNSPPFTITITERLAQLQMYLL